jgi:hypothetical protein
VFFFGARCAAWPAVKAPQKKKTSEVKPLPKKKKDQPVVGTYTVSNFAALVA